MLCNKNLDRLRANGAFSLCRPILSGRFLMHFFSASEIEPLCHPETMSVRPLVETVETFRADGSGQGWVTINGDAKLWKIEDVDMPATVRSQYWDFPVNWTNIPANVIHTYNQKSKRVEKTELWQNSPVAINARLRRPPPPPPPPPKAKAAKKKKLESDEPAAAPKAKKAKQAAGKPKRQHKPKKKAAASEEPKPQPAPSAPTAPKAHEAPAPVADCKSTDNAVPPKPAAAAFLPAPSTSDLEIKLPIVNVPKVESGFPETPKTYPKPTEANDTVPEHDTSTREADGWVFATDTYKLIDTAGGKNPEKVKGSVLAYSTASGLSRRLNTVPAMRNESMQGYDAILWDNIVVMGKTPEVVTCLGAYVKHNQGSKKESQRYGIVVGRIVRQPNDPTALSFKQAQRMSWKKVDIDASKGAGKATPTEIKAWCNVLAIYDPKKLGPKEKPAEMLEFVSLDDQKLEVIDKETEGEEEQAVNKDGSGPSKSVINLKCPDYFIKTEKDKRESKPPAKYEPTAPQAKKKKSEGKEKPPKTPKPPKAPKPDKPPAEPVKPTAVTEPDSVLRSMLQQILDAQKENKQQNVQLPAQPQLLQNVNLPRPQADHKQTNIQLHQHVQPPQQQQQPLTAETIANAIVLAQQRANEQHQEFQQAENYQFIPSVNLPQQYAQQPIQQYVYGRHGNSQNFQPRAFPNQSLYQYHLMVSDQEMHGQQMMQRSQFMRQNGFY
eukprot:g58837.t1